MKTISSGIFIILAWLSLTFLSSTVTAEEMGVEALSSDIREMLQKEMVAIDSAMKEIVSANAAGDSEKIALIAKQIKESFILKRGLTEHQKHQLHSKLPSDFLSQDQQFHYMAGMLEHAAQNNKSELIGFYYSKLFDACSSCHKVHATHKFTMFSNDSKVNDHQH